jgi:hypothetical protein
MTPAKRKPIKLCEHIKSDGTFCRGLASRNRRYCRFHVDFWKRRHRMQRYRRQVQLAEEKRQAKRRALKWICNSPVLKHIAVKSYGEKFLRHTLGLNPDVSNFCKPVEGEGVDPEPAVVSP